jgi:hypothetical protein
MFRNSKKQGDAGLGQAIAYFTMKGHDVALPLTDSADWDMIVEINGSLKRVQVKTSSQLSKSGVMKFNANVNGSNMWSQTKKTIQQQSWDFLFLHHLITGKQALIPKEALSSTGGQVNLGGKKYNEFIIN